MIRYVTVGNLTIDEILLPDGRYEESQCGGNCLYAAVGAHIWSQGIGIVSLIGRDFPAAWLQAFSEAGIDISGVVLEERMESMRASLAYAPDGERSVLEENSAGRGEYEKRADEWADWLAYSPSPDHFPRAYATAVGVHLAPMPVQSHYPLALTLQKPGRWLTLDSPWWDGAAGDHTPQLPLLNRLDALLPSLADVRAFFGEEVEAISTIRALGRLGPDVIVIKLGPEGCLVYSTISERVTHVSAFPSETVDPTGAGDAFCGGFLVGLVETGDPVKAACYGTVSASFVVEGFSSLYALQVSRADAEQRLGSIHTETM